MHPQLSAQNTQYYCKYHFQAMPVVRQSMHLLHGDFLTALEKNKTPWNKFKNSIPSTSTIWPDWNIVLFWISQLLFFCLFSRQKIILLKWLIWYWKVEGEGWLLTYFLLYYRLKTLPFQCAVLAMHCKILIIVLFPSVLFILNNGGDNCLLELSTIL